VKKRAYLRDVSPEACAYHHALDADVVASIKAGYNAAEGWKPPPLLVVERDNAYVLLDGHHRVAAARELKLESIPAYVLSEADYTSLLNEHFGGQSPPHLAPLYGYITVDDDGWPYPLTQMKWGK